MSYSRRQPDPDDSRPSPPAPWSTRDWPPRTAPPPLRPVRSAKPDRRFAPRTERLPDAAQRQLAAAEFAVRWERRAESSILWLSGTLDRATRTLLDHQIDPRAMHSRHLIVDLTGITFIDSAGLDALLYIHERAAQQDRRLSFRHGPHVAQRPLELTGHGPLRSRWGSRPSTMNHEESFFALAMACANVDHPRPGDRPGAP